MKLRYVADVDVTVDHHILLEHSGRSVSAHQLIVIVLVSLEQFEQLVQAARIVESLALPAPSDWDHARCRRLRELVSANVLVQFLVNGSPMKHFLLCVFVPNSHKNSVDSNTSELTSMSMQAAFLESQAKLFMPSRMGR